MSNTKNFSNTDLNTVMCKSGYQSKPPVELDFRIIAGMLWKVLLILGGLNGTWVLRGTQSSNALVAVGIILLAGDIVSFNYRKKKSAEAYAVLRSQMIEKEKAAKRDERTLSTPVRVCITFKKDLSALDFSPRLNGNIMNRDVEALTYTAVTGRVHNIISFDCLDLYAVFDIADQNGNDIDIALIRNKIGFGISLPGSVTMVSD